MADNIATSTDVAGEKHTKEYHIIVNAEQKVVEAETVSYEQVVHLVYPVPPAPDSHFTVTYRNAKEPKEGSLAPGKTVKVKEQGSIFNVTPTNKS